VQRAFKSVRFTTNKVEEVGNNLCAMRSVRTFGKTRGGKAEGLHQSCPRDEACLESKGEKVRIGRTLAYALNRLSS